MSSTRPSIPYFINLSMGKECPLLTAAEVERHVPTAAADAPLPSTSLALRAGSMRAADDGDHDVVTKSELDKVTARSE
ncbi:hypothetical protein EVAR_13139_1 [Eumeta japonica]|uniref:Uncharacterized protein n=1 Tax=Eumeta variegata TaxID=151549 RepID=A0A4C1U9X4_EUMVA|nr:hypothetical protein EVAR_13139_1 [Eumeta japonica]